MSPFPWLPERPPLSPEDRRFLLVVDGASRELVYAAEAEEQLQNQDIHTRLATEEGRDSPGLAVGGEDGAAGPSEVLRYEEAETDAREELDRARARVAELEQWLNPRALVERDRLEWAAAVAQVELDEREERRIEQERVDEHRRHLELERVTNRLKAMTESARTGRPVTLYFGDGRAPLPVTGPRWLAVQPPYGTPEEKAWEHRFKSLIANETEKVRREMEEEELAGVPTLIFANKQARNAPHPCPFVRRRADI